MKPFLSRSYLLHTTLLPIFFVLHTWNNFHYLVKFKDIFVILLGILIFSFTLLSITILFLRNRKKASVLNFFLIAYMLFYGYIYDQLQHYIKFLSRHSILLTAFLLLFIAGVFFLKRRKDNRLEKSTMYLNSLLLIFCIYEITNTLLILNTNNKKKIQQQSLPHRVKQFTRIFIYWFLTNMQVVNLLSVIMVTTTQALIASL